jgi:5'-nucleotidase
MLLPVLHFNDVYRVSKQKLQSGDTIDVSQFAQRVDGLRDAWPKETGGLLLFSGDLFSPSVESSVVLALRVCCIAVVPR